MSSKGNPFLHRDIDDGGDKRNSKYVPVSEEQFRIEGGGRGSVVACARSATLNSVLQDDDIKTGLPRKPQWEKFNNCVQNEGYNRTLTVLHDAGREYKHPYTLDLEEACTPADGSQTAECLFHMAVPDNDASIPGRQSRQVTMTMTPRAEQLCKSNSTTRVEMNGQQAVKMRDPNTGGSHDTKVQSGEEKVKMKHDKDETTNGVVQHMTGTTLDPAPGVTMISDLAGWISRDVKLPPSHKNTGDSHTIKVQSGEDKVKMKKDKDETTNDVVQDMTATPLDPAPGVTMISDLEGWISGDVKLPPSYQKKGELTASDLQLPLPPLPCSENVSSVVKSTLGKDDATVPPASKQETLKEGEQQERQEQDTTAIGKNPSLAIISDLLDCQLSSGVDGCVSESSTESMLAATTMPDHNQEAKPNARSHVSATSQCSSNLKSTSPCLRLPTPQLPCLENVSLATRNDGFSENPGNGWQDIVELDHESRDPLSVCIEACGTDKESSIDVQTSTMSEENQVSAYTYEQQPGAFCVPGPGQGNVVKLTKAVL